MVKDELIHRAREAHKQGELAAAEELYRQALAKNPNDSDANHFLGVIRYQQGEYEAALELIQRAVTTGPEHAAAHNNLGSVQRELGRYQEAIRSCSMAIFLQPDFFEAYNNLGMVYRKTGRFEDAERAYRKAIQLNPQYVKALNNLGNLFLEKGDCTESLNWYGKALEGDPDLPLSHYNLGCALLGSGRLDEAEAALLKALAGEAQMIEALNTLGRLYCLRFQFEQALDVLQQALALRPESEEVFLSLGNTYCSMGRFGEAAYYLKKAVQLVPGSAEVNNSLGLVYNFLGKMDEAYACLDNARQISPDNPEILCNLAALYITRGLFGKSSAVSRKAIELQPDCGRAYFQLAQVIHGSEAEELIAAMTVLLGKGNLTYMQQMQLQFGLAKLFEEQKEYSRAFDCLARGNGLKRKTFKFSLNTHRQIVKRTCEIYDEKAIHRFAGKGHLSNVPIFIVGMPRSGTSLVEQILASHPDVYGAGELQLLYDTITNYLHIVSVSEIIPPDISLQDEDFPELGKRYAEQLRLHAPEALRITDKMVGNYLYLGLINLILPEAKIIHCSRNPIDTCLSIYKKLFARGHQYAYHLEELGGFYILYHRMMQHWNTVLAGKFLNLSYEDLVADQVGETQRLLDFCGLEWNKECLQFYKHNRPVQTASAVQVRQPITNSSVGLWKRYEEGLRPLMSMLQPCLDI